MRTYEINRSQLKRQVGVFAGDPDANKYKNTVISYIDGEIPVFIKTNLTQKQWNLFCDGMLSEEEILKSI